MFEVGKKYEFPFYKEPCVCIFVGTTISVFQHENENDFCISNINFKLYPEHKEPLKGPVRYMGVIRDRKTSNIYYRGIYHSEEFCREDCDRFDSSFELLDTLEIKWEEKIN